MKGSALQWSAELSTVATVTAFMAWFVVQLAPGPAVNLPGQRFGTAVTCGSSGTARVPSK